MEKQLTKKQEAKLNSARATESYVDENIAVIRGIPAFMTTFSRVKAGIADILEQAQTKSGSLAGIAAGKSTSRQNLSTKTVAIAGLIYTYAADIKDETLRQEMNIKQSRLKRTRDDELAPLCQFVHDRAQMHLAELADYNVNPQKLTDLQSAIDNFKAEAPKPRSAVSMRKTTNFNIVEDFRALDADLEIFDRQIRSLAEENPDFVRTYFSNREIVDSSKKIKAIKDGANTV